MSEEESEEVSQGEEVSEEENDPPPSSREEEVSEEEEAPQSRPQKQKKSSPIEEEESSDEEVSEEEEAPQVRPKKSPPVQMIKKPLRAVPKVKRKAPPSCIYVITRGDNEGQYCGKTARYNGYCKPHSTTRQAMEGNEEEEEADTYTMASEPPKQKKVKPVRMAKHSEMISSFDDADDDPETYLNIIQADINAAKARSLARGGPKSWTRGSAPVAEKKKAPVVEKKPTKKPAAAPKTVKKINPLAETNSDGGSPSPVGMRDAFARESPRVFEDEEEKKAYWDKRKAAHKKTKQTAAPKATKSKKASVEQAAPKATKSKKASVEQAPPDEEPKDVSQLWHVQNLGAGLIR